MWARRSWPALQHLAPVGHGEHAVGHARVLGSASSSDRRLGSSVSGGYTPGMKTAVSIPDDLFEQAERLARRVGATRSGLYSRAVREYVARHAPDEVTASMDRVCDAVGQKQDDFVAAAAREALERSDW